MHSSSLSIFHSYCIEFWRCMGKTLFSSSTAAYFNHAVITARQLVRVGLRNEPMHGGGVRANDYAVRHSPPKYEGCLAILSDALSPQLRFLLFSDKDPSLLTLHWCRDPPLKCLSSWIGPLAATSLQIWSSPFGVRKILQIKKTLLYTKKLFL